MKKIIEGVKEGMELFGKSLSTVVSFVLLTFVYLIGVGLTSISTKFFLKSFLNLKPDDSESYWEDLILSKKINEYYRQF